MNNINFKKILFHLPRRLASRSRVGLQSPLEIIGTTTKNGVVPDATSNEQPI